MKNGKLATVLNVATKIIALIANHTDVSLKVQVVMHFAQT